MKPKLLCIHGKSPVEPCDDCANYRPAKTKPLYTQQEIEADNKACWFFNILAIAGTIAFFIISFFFF